MCIISVRTSAAAYEPFTGDERLRFVMVIVAGEMGKRMAADGKIRYFLGSNSAEGFFSYCGEYLPAAKRKQVYIIKGGPGTGKSGFMKRVGAALEHAGLRTEYIHCASDPDSLDGVVFPEIGGAILDGTAPHVQEPACPGAVENYLSFSPFWDTAGIALHRKEIEEIQLKIKPLYTGATRCLAAAAGINGNVLDIALGTVSFDRLTQRGRALARRYISAGAQTGCLQNCFLGAITPNGQVCFGETVRTLCQNIVVLSDSLGLSPFILAPVLDAVKSAGLDAMVCHCPLNPYKIEHILIPALSLAFVTSNDHHDFQPEKARRIRVDYIPDREALEALHPSIKEQQRLCRRLIARACANLAEAKRLHDELEQFYIPYVDFTAVEALADKTADRLANT